MALWRKSREIVLMILLPWYFSKEESHRLMTNLHLNSSNFCLIRFASNKNFVLRKSIKNIQNGSECVGIHIAKFIIKLTIPFPFSLSSCASFDWFTLAKILLKSCRKYVLGFQLKGRGWNNRKVLSLARFPPGQKFEKEIWQDCKKFSLRLVDNSTKYFDLYQDFLIFTNMINFGILFAGSRNLWIVFTGVFTNRVWSFHFP